MSPAGAGRRSLAGADGLAAALARAEFLVTLLPQTAATENLLDAARLAQLPAGAVIVNPGRGTLIDEAALLAALDSGHLAHATLDVFREEPLPAEHPFWAHPRVTVTPHVAAETRAIRDAFAPKRQMLVDGLSSLGVRLDLEPEGTFYAWGDLSGLPEGLRDGQAFFQAALAERVITVPGDFFDVDPGRRRSGRPSRFARHARFSFGPSADTLRTALRRLEGIIGYRS